MESPLRARHIYQHDVDRFEQLINQAIEAILSEGATIADIQC